MKDWPKSAYISFIILTLLYGLFSIGLYRHAVASHSAVGFNNGKIQQTNEIMAIIQKSVPVMECNELQNGELSIEFLRVKADAIDMVIDQDGSVRFCKH